MPHRPFAISHQSPVGYIAKTDRSQKYTLEFLTEPAIFQIWLLIHPRRRINQVGYLGVLEGNAVYGSIQSYRRSRTVCYFTSSAADLVTQQNRTFQGAFEKVTRVC